MIKHSLRNTIACLSLLAALILALPALAQQLTPDMLEKAAAQSGLSQEELLRRYQAQRGAPAGQDTALTEPGRTQLPTDANAMVVLPFADELLAEARLDSLVLKPADDDVAENTFFGEDFFRLDAGVFNPSTFGPVPQDYLVGVGDQIVVDVWGEVEFRHERIVDRDGSIILPRAGKIQCNNRTLGEVDAAVRKQLSRSYSGIDPDGEGGSTYVAVSLGALRAIRVFVVGDVAQPGAYELSSVATVFSALYAAGGPGPQGSLRRIALKRGNENVASLDLYDYLLTGKRGQDAILRDGDTVFVPNRGLTVGITGEVNRPLRFELLPDEGVRDLIRYAGGFTAEAAATIVHVERILPPHDRRPDQPDRKLLDFDLRHKMIYMMQNGDQVTVDRIDDRLENWVQISGNVKRPGRYQFRPGDQAADLVGRAGGLWSDTLNDRALLDRIDERGVYRSADFNLDAVMRGETPMPLQARDHLRIFSIWDIQQRYQVSIAGEVSEPGDFDFREGMTLRDLILKAGGMTDAADWLHAEVSRLKQDAIGSRDTGSQPESMIDVIKVELGENWLTECEHFELRAHDFVSIRKLPWWQLRRTVSVRGEVAYPGVYVLDKPDERLSSIIARAGGLKPTAFAPGARIARKSGGAENVAIDLGRAMKDPGSQHDATLENGDELLIPSLPTTVKVTGAVGYPTSIVYESGKSIGDYVARAGGYAVGADKRKTHVVYPNGMSRPVKRFMFDPSVMQGSTIVVPMKQPDDSAGRLATMKEIASILASVATVWLVVDRTN
jgi:protein involved in polysaccharide export with SLBB domain